MNALLLDKRYLVARVFLLPLNRLFLFGRVLRLLFVLLRGLMSHVSLLSMAEMFGLAHYRPMECNPQPVKKFGRIEIPQRGNAPTFHIPRTVARYLWAAGPP
jgi:hypothetical protein